MKKNKALILDRDGTLIEDKDYAYKIEDLKLLPGVIKGLKLLQKDFLLFIVTNQSGIGRGYYTINDFHAYNNHLLDLLNEKTIKIKRTYFCPHIKEDNCECRKPKTKFINMIAKEFEIDLKRSWVIGDHPSDIKFGVNAGCRTAYLTTGHGERHLKELNSFEIKPTIICDNFYSAAKRILKSY
ncbi:MAG: D-glycero-alpha-D-manno-heptose-1,7-bisphosphate 7-phosphatase [Promethearchaeota archaeon]